MSVPHNPDCLIRTIASPGAASGTRTSAVAMLPAPGAVLTNARIDCSRVVDCVSRSHEHHEARLNPTAWTTVSALQIILYTCIDIKTGIHHSVRRFAPGSHPDH